MKIGIDVKMLTGKAYTGIPRYVHEVLREWNELYPEHEYYLISNGQIVLDFEPGSNWHMVIEKPVFKMRKIWSLLQLPVIIRKLNLDAFWGTNYSLPRDVKGCRYYVTIYDLAIIKFGGIGDFVNELKVKLFTKSSCARARRILAISKSTAEDVSGIFDIDKRNIFVCYCGGLAQSEKNIEEVNSEGVRESLLFEEPFFLFIGTIEPRKNLITVIKAFEKYVDDTGSNMKMILAGGRGWRCDGIYETFENCSVRNQIIMPGFISKMEKRYLLSRAKVFLYPSIYEGFGIPILEAFEYGVPTITTNVSSLPEVGGDAAIYISDAYDYDELCSKMKIAENLNDDQLKELRIKMKKRLESFSWEKTAVSMMDVITEKQF